MRKSEIKVGQRVELVKDVDYAKAGMVGTVKEITSGTYHPIGVEFDKEFEGGHTLGGTCKKGYGHYVGTNDIKFVSTGYKVGEYATKYKPGDVVTVRSDLRRSYYKMADGSNGMETTDQMLTKRGQKVKIKSVTKTGKYMIEGSIFPWVDEMFVDESKAEPTYKIGDRVVIGDSNIGGKYKGQIGTIAKFDPTYSYPYGVVDSEHNGGGCLWCKVLGYAPEEPNAEKKKFTVGDRIEMLCDEPWAEKGMTGTIIMLATCGCHDYAVKFDKNFHGGHTCGGMCDKGFVHWINHKNVKLIGNEATKKGTEKTESECKFKPGDKVVMIKNYCAAKIGMVGTIKGLENGYYAVEFHKGFDGHSCNSFKIPGNRGHYIPERFMKIYPYKFKVGDRVSCNGIWTGIIRCIKDKECHYGVEHDDKSYNGHNCNGFELVYGSRPTTARCEWCYTSELRLIEETKSKEEPVKTWELVIRGEGDKTTAEYRCGDVTKKAEVNRFHEDQYSIHKAIEFVTNKILPEEKWVVGVKFDKGEKVYNYYTTDNTIKVGDKVVVPTGKDNHHVAVTVVDIKPEADCKLSSAVLRNMKYVDRKCTEEDTPKYYNGKVVCVKSNTEHWTVGKIYEIKDGMVTSDKGLRHPRVGVPYLDVNDIRHIGSEMFADARHNPKNEFIPIVE